MEQSKEYFAFISYKREDEKWAKWLQHKLEHYHLPTNVRKSNPSLPQNIRPVFKDTSELGAGVLADEIHEALESSKYLIVICSPRAAQSQWVGKEVQTFIDMGKSDKIIPFIIGGKPFSEIPEEECFPSALLNLPKEQELLGVNINEMGRDAAVVKVIARMFDLKFDTLWQRFEREQKKRRWLIVGGAILFALTSFVIGGIIAEKNIELDKANRDLESAYYEIKTEKEQKEKANASLLLANDSIIKQRNKLQETNNELEKKNRDLQIQKEKTEEAERQTAKNLVRLRMELANQLLNNGDSYTARMLALEALTNENNPYMPEAEAVLRKSSSNNAIINTGYDILHVKNVITGIGVTEIEYDNKRAITKGNYIISNDDNLKVWDVHSGALTKSLSLYKSKISIVKNRVLIAKDDSLYTFDENWNLILKKVFKHKIDFLPDNSTNHIALGGADSKDLYIYDSDTGDSIVSLKGNVKDIKFVSYSNDGSIIATASKDGCISVWNAGTGKLKKTWFANQNDTQAPIFSRTNSQILSCSRDSTIRIWDINSGECLDSVSFPSLVTSFIVSDNELTVWAGCEDGNVYNSYINHSRKGINQVLTGHSGLVKSIAYNPVHKRFISLGLDGTIRIWDRNNQPQDINYVMRDTTCWSPLGNISYNATGNVIASVNDSKIVLYNKYGVFKKTLEGHTAWVRSMAFSNDGKKLVSVSGDSTLRIWDVEKGKELHKFVCHSEVLSASFSPDGNHIISSSRDSTIRVWDVSGGVCVSRIPINNIEAIECMPDGKSFWRRNNGGIYKYSIKTGLCIDSIGHCDNFYKLNPDGTLMICNSSNTIFIWDLKKHKIISKWITETKIYGLEFSYNSKYCLSFDLESLSIWDVYTGTLIKEYKYMDLGLGSIMGASFSPDGQAIIVNSSKQVTMWRFPPLEGLIDQARKRFANRKFTPVERLKYYFDKN